MTEVYTKLISTAVEQAAKKTQQDVLTPASGGESPFKQMLDSLTGGEQMTDMLGMGRENTNIGGTRIEALSGEGINVNAADFNVGLEQPKGTEKIVDMLSEVNKGQMQMDNLVNEILYSGKKFSNQELLAIQAHVFHFAQMTELTVKVAEQGVTSVKTVLNTQIQ